MSEKNTGGSAFPTAYHDCASSFDLGMTLRDWFAGQALAVRMVNGFATVADAETNARVAYAIADAMLKARGEA